jgi:hypothetical protein
LFTNYDLLTAIFGQFDCYKYCGIEVGGMIARFFAVNWVPVLNISLQPALGDLKKK